MQALLIFLATATIAAGIAPKSGEELIRDMLTIVTVFAGRLYGQRAKGLRTRFQRALKECEQTPEGSHGTGQADHQTAP